MKRSKKKRKIPWWRKHSFVCFWWERSHYRCWQALSGFATISADDLARSHRALREVWQHFSCILRLHRARHDLVKSEEFLQTSAAPDHRRAPVLVGRVVRESFLCTRGCVRSRGRPVGRWRSCVFEGDVLIGTRKGTGMNSKHRSSADGDPRGHGSWDCQWCAESSPGDIKAPRKQKDKSFLPANLQFSLVNLQLKFIPLYKRTWSMTLALKMASSMCFSSDLMTHLMLLTTCWTSGGRLQLECSRNLATNILVSLYILRSARECGRSWGECVYGGRGLRWMSTFLPSFCCFETGARVGLAPTTSAETSLVSKRENKVNLSKL